MTHGVAFSLIFCLFQTEVFRTRDTKQSGKGEKGEVKFGYDEVNDLLSYYS